MDAQAMALFGVAALLPGGVSYLVQEQHRKGVLALGLVCGLLAWLSSLVVCAAPWGQDGAGPFLLLLVAALMGIPLLTAPRPGWWWRGLAHLVAALLAGAGLWFGGLLVEVGCHGLGFF